MNIALIFAGGNPLRDIITIGQHAEAAGCASLYMVEAYRSAWIALTALAGATSRVRLGPYVLNAYARSPLLTGMTAIDFQEFSGGRLVLGLGGGNRVINEVWQGIPHARVLTKMREYVEILQRMTRTPAGTPFVYDGQIHRMRWTPAIDTATAPFPVYLAAVFPAMLRVAASVADGIAGGATLSARYLRDTAQPLAAQFAAAAGRDPATLRWNAVMFTAVSPDRARARQAARAALCSLFAPLPHPYYEFTMREQGFARVVDQLRDWVPAGRREAAMEAIPDELIDDLMIAGTPDECRSRIAQYAGLVDELLLLNALPPSGDDGLSTYTDLFDVIRASMPDSARVLKS
jgi:5,10-methylenetetrahydromethanopterin reductase